MHTSSFMGRRRKPIHIPLTTINVSVEIAEALNKQKKKGETQDQLIRRLLIQNEQMLSLIDERNEWEKQSKQWEEVYNQLTEDSGKRIRMLESELKQGQHPVIID
jgi:hypothetical protein